MAWENVKWHALEDTVVSR